jgi:hypothetical protein
MKDMKDTRDTKGGSRLSDKTMAVGDRVDDGY